MNTQTIIVIAITTMPILSIVSVVALALFRPEQDNAALIATILGFSGTTVVSLLALLASTKAAETAALAVQSSKNNSTGIEKVHALVNSQSAELLKVTSEMAFTRGLAVAEASTTTIAAGVAAGVVEAIRATGEHKPLSER